jgi:enoyl-CoA hydratase/carnithine racemase
MSTVPPVVTTIERADGASVARIVLNRPQARNAITVALAEGLSEALRAAAAQAQVIVIRGAGGHFCAGGDFHERKAPTRSAGSSMPSERLAS